MHMLIITVFFILCCCSPGVERPIFTWTGTEYYSFFLGSILSRTLPTTQICLMAPSRGWGFWKKNDVSEKSVILKTLNPYPVPSCSFEMLDIRLTNNHHKRYYSKKGRVLNSTVRLLYLFFTQQLTLQLFIFCFCFPLRKWVGTGTSAPGIFQNEHSWPLFQS